MMSFWTFSDVFEESGVIPLPFEGHFGLRAKGGINKPSYYGFALMHQPGDRRLANEAKNAIVTRRSDGTLVVAVWNLVDPDQTGTSKPVNLVFDGVPANATAWVSRVGDDSGNTLKAYKALGSPRYATDEQVRKINSASAPAAPAAQRLNGNSLSLTLEPNALVLVEVSAH